MLREKVSLIPYSHYRIGGAADYFFEGKTIDELIEAVKKVRQMKLPFFVLGGGTNLLVGDDGFRGAVLKPGMRFIETQGNLVQVGAGTSVEEFLGFIMDHGLSGWEWAGGLPGTIGGAVRGNAGAFGGETKDTIHEVVSLDARGKSPTVIRRALSDCRFGYRDSVFKKSGGREIVLEAVFRLKPGDKRAIREAIEAKIAYRRERHPIDYPNIGSIFKNVEVKLIPKKHLAALRPAIKNDPFPVVPAAYLIAQAGLKGVSFGGALISPKHPNFIVNALNARAADVKALIALIKEKVKSRFGIKLEEEIMYV